MVLLLIFFSHTFGICIPSNFLHINGILLLVKNRQKRNKIVIDIYKNIFPAVPGKKIANIIHKSCSNTQTNHILLITPTLSMKPIVYNIYTNIL